MMTIVVGDTRVEKPSKGAASSSDKPPSAGRAIVDALVSNARRQFGPVVFWNVPTPEDDDANALLVIRRLRHYGGRKGWIAAAEIEHAMTEERAGENGADGVSVDGARPDRCEQVAE